MKRQKNDYQKNWQTLYSVSLEISTLRMVYISLKKARSSSFVTVTVVEGASHTVIVKIGYLIAFSVAKKIVGLTVSWEDFAQVDREAIGGEIWSGTKERLLSGCQPLYWPHRFGQHSSQLLSGQSLNSCSGCRAMWNISFRQYLLIVMSAGSDFRLIVDESQ